jgi:hypothetical protein
MSQFFQGPSASPVPGAQASPAMALLAQAISGAQQPQPNPPLSQDPTAEARAGYSPEEAAYHAHIRNAGMGAGTGRNYASSPLGLHIREAADTAGEAAHKEAVSATGFDPNAGGGGVDPYADRLQPIEGGYSQPTDRSFAQAAANTPLADLMKIPTGALQQHPVTPGDQMTIGRGIPGEQGYTENTTLFGGPNGPVTTQTAGGANSLISNLKGRVSDADLNYLNQFSQQPGVTPAHMNDAVNSALGRFAGEANKTRLADMTKWKTQTAANLQERNTAYRNLQSAQKRLSTIGDSILSSPEDRQRAQDTLTQAQSDFETADQKYTKAVDAIPNMSESQQAPTTQPVNYQQQQPVGVLQRLLQQRQQSQQTRSFNGQTYQLGQTINVGGKSYQVSGFNPDSGEPMVVPQ